MILVINDDIDKSYLKKYDKQYIDEIVPLEDTVYDYLIIFKKQQRVKYDSTNQ